MITVYNASNSIEAYLIKNLLQQQEIPAYVFGDYLQGGVGEIQAIGLVTVNVSDSDFAAAKGIIEAWNAATIIENVDTDYNCGLTYPSA